MPICIQVVSIATISITWVSMTASVMGQNLYFNIAETPLVCLQKLNCCLIKLTLNACSISMRNAEVPDLIQAPQTGWACSERGFFLCLLTAEGILCELQVNGALLV